ncbi:MAG: hypothetical protein P8Z49_07640 [Acidobacteriota bacterium]|jgi:hypothetical protein
MIIKAVSCVLNACAIYANCFAKRHFSRNPQGFPQDFPQEGWKTGRAKSVTIWAFCEVRARQKARKKQKTPPGVDAEIHDLLTVFSTAA